MTGVDARPIRRRAAAPAAPVTVVAVAAVLAGAVLAGCGGAPVATARLTPVASGCIARATARCAAYTYASPSPATVVVSAPHSASGNEREFFWPHHGPSGSAETACATFSTGRSLDQQGIVLRLVELPHGRVEAVSVTRNVWMDVFDVFNFHVWDTRRPPPDDFHQFSSAVIPWLAVAPPTYPLRMCARTVPATDTVQFVVWTPGRPQPAWGSPGQGGTATLPPTAPASGRSGWYAGHLAAGTSMRYSDLSVDGSTPKGLT